MTYPGLACSCEHFFRNRLEHLEKKYTVNFVISTRQTLALEPRIPIATHRQYIFEDSQYISPPSDGSLTAKWDPCVCFQSKGYCLVSHDCSEPTQKQQSETRAVYGTMNWKESSWLTCSNSGVMVKGESYTMKWLRGNCPEFLTTQTWTVMKKNWYGKRNGFWWFQLPHFTDIEVFGYMNVIEV